MIRLIQKMFGMIWFTIKLTIVLGLISWICILLYAILKGSALF